MISTRLLRKPKRSQCNHDSLSAHESLSQALQDIVTTQTGLAKSFKSLAETALPTNIQTPTKLKTPKNPAEQKQNQALLAK